MKFFICRPDEIFNESFIGFKCKDEAHAHFIKDWLEKNQSKIVRKTSLLNKTNFENILFNPS